MKGTNKISLEAFKLRLAEMDLLIAEQGKSAIMWCESSLIKDKEETIDIQNQLIEAQRLYIAELKQITHGWNLSAKLQLSQQLSLNAKVLKQRNQNQNNLNGMDKNTGIEQWKSQQKF